MKGNANSSLSGEFSMFQVIILPSITLGFLECMTREVIETIVFIRSLCLYVGDSGFSSTVHYLISRLHIYKKILRLQVSGIKGIFVMLPIL